MSLDHNGIKILCFVPSFLKNNIHVQPAALELRSRYGHRLRELQHRYTNKDGFNMGGIVVSDPIQKQNAIAMFKDV